MSDKLSDNASSHGQSREAASGPIRLSRNAYGQIHGPQSILDTEAVVPNPCQTRSSCRFDQQ